MVYKSHMEKDLYMSLDDAKKEIAKRWNDPALKDKIEEELGQHFIELYKSGPRAVLTRHVASPDNGFYMFYYLAKYLGVVPTAQEFLGDLFVHFNDEKKALAKISLKQNGEIKPKKLVDFHKCEKTALLDCKMVNGVSLVEFHHLLLAEAGLEVQCFDNTDWYKSIGKAKDYYYWLLLHFVAHGVLVETFSDEEDITGFNFTREIVTPAIQRIEDKFGMRPIVVRLYSDNQTDEEDIFWWAYPKELYNFMAEYIKINKI